MKSINLKCKSRRWNCSRICFVCWQINASAWRQRPRRRRQMTNVRLASASVYLSISLSLYLPDFFRFNSGLAAPSSAHATLKICLAAARAPPTVWFFVYCLFVYNFSKLKWSVSRGRKGNPNKEKKEPPLQPYKWLTPRDPRSPRSGTGWLLGPMRHLWP